MKTEAYINKERQPFMYEFYNTKFFMQQPLSSVRLLENRVINAFIEGLNEMVKLPKYILVVLDKNLIDAVDTEFGVKLALMKMVNYISNELIKAINCRKDDIKMKRPGGLASSGEPRLIWVSVVHRPKNTHPNMHHIYKLVSKTNEVIEEVVKRNNRISHILYVESVNEYMHFDHVGKLTDIGKQHYWEEVDKKVKQLDRGETDLLPREYERERSFGPMNMPRRRRNEHTNRNDHINRHRDRMHQPTSRGNGNPTNRGRRH